MIGADEYRRRLGVWLDEARDRADAAGERTLDLQRENARRMREEGLAGPTWPKSYGGVGGGPEHEAVFEAVIGGHEDLLPPRLVTSGICAPTIRDFGTEEQRLRYLPHMISGEEIWAQLLSEPDAGSDLASVSTRARRVDGGWRVTGQKVWTSRADVASSAIALVRTSAGSGPRDRRALTALVVDMHADGIDVRPLREMTGDALFNEVFLDDVFVPDEAVLGGVDGGWPVLLGMLGHERDAVGAVNTANSIYQSRAPELSARVAALRTRERDAFRHELVRLAAWEYAHDALGARIAAARGTQRDRPFGSVSKVSVAGLAASSSELAARIEGLRITGAPGAPGPNDPAYWLLKSPMAGIAGGTTEIQKNTIALRILMLRNGGAGNGNG